MTEFNLDEFEDGIIRKSKLTKKQLWKEMSKEKAYDYINEKTDIPFFFVSSVFENKTIKARKESFFKKQDDLSETWTQQMFNEREKKFRELILQSPLIHSDIAEKFVSVILENNSVKKRVDSFFSNSDLSTLISEKEFLFLEKKYREYILENKDLNINDLTVKLLKFDKMKVVLKIKDIELEETYQRVKDWAKSIPEDRVKRDQMEKLAQGKGRMSKDALGNDVFIENDPWYYKIVFGLIIILMFYGLSQCVEVSPSAKDEYCTKYKRNYPLSTSSDCSRSWDKLKEY